MLLKAICYIVGASGCIAVLNYFATQRELADTSAIALFALKFIPLSVASTVLFALYYNLTREGANFGALMLGAYFTSLMLALAIQVFLLRQPITPHQAIATALFVAGIAVLAYPKWSS